MVGAERIAANLAAVRERLAAAAARAGREPAGVRLLPVTKTVGPAEVEALLALGVTALGESRVADALAKAAQVRPPAGVAPRWELVGHLQRNKVRKALELFAAVHSVDSPRLVEALAAEAEQRGKTVEVFLEVNLAGEATKSGLRPEEVPEVLRLAAGRASLAVVGLMTLAPLVAGDVAAVSAAARPVFRGLRELRDALNARALYPRPLTELSMGMSGDFEVAVEEGATVVRVGTALFA